MTLNATPKVSVMMPVYNSAPYLARTLESILTQTFADFELVIIDDGSSDDSVRVLNEHAAGDPRIRLTCRKNRGAVTTRNEILAQCRGEYLAVNDADDISLRDRLRQQVAFLDANPQVVCAGGEFDIIHAAGRRLTTLHPPPDDAEIQRLSLRGHCAICHSAGMMRTAAVRRAGGYDSDFRFAHDLELWLRLGEIGQLANLPQTVIQFRLHDKSISETKREEQREFCRRACEGAWSRRGIENGVFEAAEPWRPGRDRASRHRYAMQYGWWAFNSGERRTAILYGAKAVAAKPWSARGYRLLAAAALKSARDESGSAESVS